MLFPRSLAFLQPSNLVWLNSFHGGSELQDGCFREEEESCMACHDPALEVTQCHFCLILLFK